MIEAAVTFVAKKILDFDIETVAAGFGDPNWVPNRITAIAWSWVGEDKVEVRTILDYTKSLPGFLDYFFMGCRPMLEEFCRAYVQADVITGHNIARFDLWVLNAELMRLRLPLLPVLPKIDTMQIKSAKGFKKGQDVMSDVLEVPAKKKAMNWAEWQKAYATNGWAEIKERCASDVIQHKLLLAKLTDLGYLR